MKYYLAIFMLSFFLLSTPAIAATSYQNYINTLPTPAPVNSTNQAIVNKLVNEINKIPADAACGFQHLAPAVVKIGLNNTNAEYTDLYWNTPGELISTLSSAYPYLPSNLQTKVKTYLDCEISKYNPLTVGYFPPNSSSSGLGSQAGVRREFFPLDQTLPLNFYPGYPPISIDIAYPLWQYTYYTGDQSKFVSNTSNWNALTAIFDSFRSKGVKYYSEVAGLTGFARLAKLKGDTTRAQQAIDLANLAMTGSEFATFSSNGDNRVSTLDASGATVPNHRATNGVFANGSATNCCTRTYIGAFAKEIGQFLKDNEVPAVQTYSQKIEKLDPLWFLTSPNYGGDSDLLIEREVLFAHPEMGWTNFMLHAYVFGDSFDKLQSFLDFPSRLGDLFYMQELVTTIEANQNSTAKPGDINADGVVNSSDLNLLLGNWLGSGNCSGFNCDLNSDLKINAYDAVIVLNNFGK